MDIDVLLIHAQRADRDGNVEIQGARGLDLSLLGAAKTKLFTVEEIVEVGKLGDAPKSYVLPHNFVTAVACVPMGAYPTSCLPYYSTDYRRLIGFVREEDERKKSKSVESGTAFTESSADRRGCETEICLPRATGDVSAAGCKSSGSRSDARAVGKIRIGH